MRTTVKVSSRKGPGYPLTSKVVPGFDNVCSISSETDVDFSCVETLAGHERVVWRKAAMRVSVIQGVVSRHT